MEGIQMDYIDTHKNRIRISANKNPLKAYFLGGFDLCRAKQKKQVFAYLQQLQTKKKK
jgi:hypothetical protein|tara:strand:- start:641 stop:814 length:174 start_codon:yes stop_codon:yes gene_type:complete